ncbi:19619_t:CDS:2, partial [Gigaspora rosea]
MGNKQPGQHPGQNTFITDNNNNNSNDKADKDDINDDNAQISDDELYLSDEQGGTTFVLTTKMQTLPTKIYKNNILQAEESQKLLQSFLQNKLIRFKPLPMDKDIPLNNAIKLANKTKPPSDKKEA